MARVRLRPVFAPLVALLVLLAACGQTPSTTSSPAATPSAAPSVSFPLTLTDDAGRTITLLARPQRVVSLAPSNTEIVCVLGACDALTGVTDFDDYPPNVKTVAHVVVQAKVDAEKVVAARPDLVLAAGNGLTSEAAIKQLSDLGLQVMTLYPRNLDGVYRDIDLVGRALGVPQKAESTIASMRQRVKAVSDAVAAAPRPRTFYEVSVFEGTIYTAGKDSFLASLITLAGGSPVTGDAQSGAIQLEDLIAADPELVLLGDASYDPTLATQPKAITTLRARSGWGQISAVRSGKVLPYTDDVVTTRPGPRIVEGLEALARAIHPDLFGP
ncbi:MAG: ABC transporter substrate-binding protein [Chloroflexi bacterium]|nr:MAG: ABC transporter substrate-binding protein [Chloroflexota bacterium]